MPPDDAATTEPALDAQTMALRLIVALLALGAVWMFAGLLVPFLLALVLTVALSPLASRLEARGLPTGVSSLLCTLAVIVVLGSAAGLLLYQTGTVVQHSDDYLKGISKQLSGLSRAVGGDRLVEDFGLLGPQEIRPRDPARPESETEAKAGPAVRGRSEQGATAAQGDGTEPARDESRGRRRPEAADWERFVRQNAEALGRWLVTGLGGLLGFLGGLVVFLAFLYYMLQTRAEWVERITLASARLGMRPGSGEIERVQREVVAFIGCMGLVSLGYMVLVSAALWLIGVPQPLLWGLLAGLLEVVPYFGPLIAAMLPTIVSLSLGSRWQPLAVLGLFAGLHIVDGYLVTPLLYGRAVRLNPVTILFAALFFGWLLGPLGLALATPLVVILRGLVVITPDTPALDALADVEQEKEEAQTAAT